jgi:hypothetical protein
MRIMEAGNAYRILLGKPVLNEGQEGDWIRNHRWMREHG